MDLIVPFLVLAIAPGLFWLWYFYHRDKYEPEPLSWIAIIYLLGMTITIPVAFIEGTIALLVGDFLIAIAVAPVVEEYAKYLVVRSTVYQSVEFNEPMDGIVYSTAVGLGFATLENIIYVFTSLATSPEFALQTGVIRALLSVPGHALFSSMWGYALGQAKFMAPSARPAIIAGGLIAAMISHSIFNLLLFSDIGVAVLVLVFFPFIWWIALRHIKKALAQSPFNHHRP
jgi:RsiW-degrading membrane proteinase PrsW (M82 family)